jgi:hypothetical protein
MAYYLPWGTRLASSGTDPYTWFTALDKATIPFHAGAGTWGAQSTIKEPSAPTITSFGTASNPTQLRDALATGGVQVTLTANISASAYNVAITDSEIIIPPGIVLYSPTFGGTLNQVNRLRVRGETVGSFSGGQVDHFNLFGTGADIIVDGIALSGDEDIYAMNLGPAAGFNRGAVVNCRIASGGFGIGSTCGDLVVAGCSIITGLSWPWTTNDEAYAIRAYFETNGNVVIFGNELRSNPTREDSTHARFRAHPDSGIEYIWAAQNRFVERVENWIFWVDAAAGGGSGDAIATWVVNNEIISDGTGTSGSASTPKLTGGDQVRAYIQDNVFKSSDFASDTDISMTGSTSTTKSGNTYESLPGSDPAWGASIAGGFTPGAGDPTGIDWTP